jgi:hypothetical protein
VKRGLSRAVVALVMVASFAFGSAPARAVTPAAVIAAIQAAYSLYKAVVANGLSVQDATKQILAAINGAKVEIISHIDAVATAQARACAEEVVIDFADFDVLSTDNKQAFALSATSCVTLIDSLLSVVTDKAAADQLGFAIDAIGPITLIVRSRTGLSNTGLIPSLVRPNQRVITVVTPVCNSRFIEGRTQWWCTAYNGDTSGVEPSLSLAQREASVRTSRPLAQAVLPTLNTL